MFTVETVMTLTWVNSNLTDIFIFISADQDIKMGGGWVGGGSLYYSVGVMIENVNKCELVLESGSWVWIMWG